MTGAPPHNPETERVSERDGGAEESEGSVTFEGEAGRSLDARVAVEVMGWQRGRRYGNGNGEWNIPNRTSPWALTWDQTPRYSTDIAAAWEVVGAMQASEAFDRFDGYMDSEPLHAMTAAEAARAICQAALRARASTPDSPNPEATP